MPQGGLWHLGLDSFGDHNAEGIPTFPGDLVKQASGWLNEVTGKNKDDRGGKPKSSLRDVCSLSDRI